jgi:hypothetical protein
MRGAARATLARRAATRTFVYIVAVIYRDTDWKVWSGRCGSGDARKGGKEMEGTKDKGSKERQASGKTNEGMDEGLKLKGEESLRLGEVEKRSMIRCGNDAGYTDFLYHSYAFPSRSIIKVSEAPTLLRSP